MLKHNKYLTSVFVLVGLLVGANSCTTLTESDKDAGATINADAVALSEELIFERNGFRLDEATQEGTTIKQRLTQDAIQKACSAIADAPVDAETAAKVSDLARKSIVKPAAGVKLGDWKEGEKIARSGYGFRVGHRTDDHSKREAGGNCYACHQLDPDEIAYGTIGTVLTGYGKQRGTSELS